MLKYLLFILLLASGWFSVGVEIHDIELLKGQLSVEEFLEHELLRGLSSESLDSLDDDILRHLVENEKGPQFSIDLDTFPLLDIRVFNINVFRRGLLSRAIYVDTHDGAIHYAVLGHTINEVDERKDELINICRFYYLEAYALREEEGCRRNGQ